MLHVRFQGMRVLYLHDDHGRVPDAPPTPCHKNSKTGVVVLEHPLTRMSAEQVDTPGVGAHRLGAQVGGCGLRQSEDPHTSVNQYARPIDTEEWKGATGGHDQQARGSAIRPACPEAARPNREWLAGNARLGLLHREPNRPDRS